MKSWLPVAAFVVVNLAVVGLTAFKLVVGKRTSGWPAVPGTIRSSRIAFDRSTEQTSGTPFVQYDYVVNGTAHQSTIIWPDDIMIGGNAAAQRVVDRYPAGLQVPVYVNPADPDSAFLEHTKMSLRSTLGLLAAGNAIAGAMAVVAHFMF